VACRSRGCVVVTSSWMSITRRSYDRVVSTPSRMSVASHSRDGGAESRNVSWWSEYNTRRRVLIWHFEFCWCAVVVVVVVIIIISFVFSLLVAIIATTPSPLTLVLVIIVIVVVVVVVSALCAPVTFIFRPSAYQNGKNTNVRN
jgi:magnesium-transporting ATPase (P-type)